MKKLITSIVLLVSATTLFAQPVLVSDSMHTGLSFNLYELSNVNTANLTPAGANITWDLSSATAAVAGTADLLDMSATPYAAQYPAANFAIKITPNGSIPQYSLFHLTSSVFEEVANNVGTPNEVAFIDYRTTLVFPFTYNLTNTDTYQKTGQGQKVITNTYDAYGTLIANSTTYNNVVRDLIDDDGNTSVNLWSADPFLPLFQASSSGFELWQLTSTPTGISEMHSNSLFDMYPNPATQELKIINKKLISKIEIYNVTGELQFTTTQSVIDISGLSSGVYVIKAYAENGPVTQEFVKN